MKTTRRFCKGEFVVEFVGELITEKQGVEREESYPEEKGSFVFYFKHRGKSWCVDATEESGRLGRLINHSKTNTNVARRCGRWKMCHTSFSGHFVILTKKPNFCMIMGIVISGGEGLIYFLCVRPNPTKSD